MRQDHRAWLRFVGAPWVARAFSPIAGIAGSTGEPTGEVLLSIKKWQFNWQRDYRLAVPVRFSNGDRLSIRCTHRNRTRRNVTWGENSSDEMCIGFVYVSEL